MTDPYGLYLHIPFCPSKCPYCAFNSIAYPGDDVVSRYMDALEQELQREWHRLPRLDSIYFGGGTPSMAPVDRLGRLLSLLSARYDLQDVEITLEANPGTVDYAYLQEAYQVGFNRVTFGIQSLEPHLLEILGRRHTREEALIAVTAARRAGFSRINMDFIYAIPGQTMVDWQRTMSEVIALQPGHISMYGLEIEEGTPYHRWHQAGRLHKPAEELEMAMRDWAEEQLAKIGVYRYEISNYARPGEESVHNSNYWRYGNYLGVGAGAHSHFHGRRFWNLKSQTQYVERIEAHKPVHVGTERLLPHEAAAEWAMIGLRLKDGISYEAFERRFLIPFAELFPDVEASLIEDGFAEKTKAGFCLTTRGFWFESYVARRFMSKSTSV